MSGGAVSAVFFVAATIMGTAALCTMPSPDKPVPVGPIGGAMLLMFVALAFAFIAGAQSA